jgi:hypothetical protein
MLELGVDERLYHREIGVYAAQRGVDVLVTVGPLAAEMAGAQAHTGSRTPDEVNCTPDAPAAAELLQKLLADGDTVLVKGSRGMGLERVGQALREHDRAGVPTTDAAGDSAGASPDSAGAVPDSTGLPAGASPTSTSDQTRAEAPTRAGGS